MIRRGLPLVMIALGVAGCAGYPAQQQAGAHASCRSYDEFGARLSIVQCAGIDRPDFGVFHEDSPAAEEPTGVGTHH